jgi:hypothetical protein
LKVALKGKRGGYGAGTLPLSAAVVVDAAAQCGTVTFADCGLNGSGSTLRCS